jgi:hypothetical protein
MFAAAAFLCTTSRAEAVEVTDDTGLRVDLDLADAAVCVVAPPKLRTPGACNDVDVPALEAMGAEIPGLVAMTAVTANGQSSVVEIVKRDVGAWRTASFDEIVSDIGRHTRKRGSVATVSGSKRDTPFDVIEVRGAPVLRVVISGLPRHRNDLQYILVGEQAVYFLELPFADGQQDFAQAIGDRLVERVTYPADLQVHRSPYPRAIVVAAWVAWLLAHGALLAAARAWRRAWRTEAAASPDAKAALERLPARMSATMSWLSFFVVVALAKATPHRSEFEPLQTIASLELALVPLFGIGCAIHALVGVRAYGRRGILLPSSIGLALNAVCLALLGWGFLRTL